MSGELIKVIAILLISSLMVTLLKTKLPEYSFLLVLAVVCIVMITVFGNLFSSVARIKNLFTQSGNSLAYFTVALKALGISYLTTFAADVCRDYGMSALAQSAEIAGKVTIFLLSLPLMNSILDMALNFAGL